MLKTSRLAELFNEMRKTLFPTADERAVFERRENIKALETTLGAAVRGKKVDYQTHQFTGAYGMIGGVGISTIIPHYTPICKKEQAEVISKAKQDLLALGVSQGRIDFVEQEALQAQHRENPNHYDFN